MSQSKWIDVIGFPARDPLIAVTQTLLKNAGIQFAQQSGIAHAFYVREADLGPARGALAKNPETLRVMTLEDLRKRQEWGCPTGSVGPWR
jgi:hypothetical protein